MFNFGGFFLPRRKCQMRGEGVQSTVISLHLSTPAQFPLQNLSGYELTRQISLIKQHWVASPLSLSVASSSQDPETSSSIRP